MTPKSVIDSRQIDGQQTQRYAEQVERQKTVKMFLGLARERVVHGRRRHADLKNTINVILHTVTVGGRHDRTRSWLGALIRLSMRKHSPVYETLSVLNTIDV